MLNVILVSDLQLLSSTSTFLMPPFSPLSRLPATTPQSRPESKQLKDLTMAEKGEEEDEEKTLLLSPDEYESPEENSAKAELQVSLLFITFSFSLCLNLMSISPFGGLCPSVLSFSCAV